MRKILSSRWTKAVLFLACLGPFGALIWRFKHDDLGANPVEFITHATGDWIIRFLLLTLCITPLRKLLNLPPLARYRRMLGLFAFFYGCLHFLTWFWFDKEFDFTEMAKDIVKRRFILMGMTAFVLMIPLAVTSTAGWVRRLGYVRWQRLHRLVYFSALAGTIHYIWLVKSDLRLPMLYFAIWLLLMIYREVDKRQVKRPAARATTPSTATLRD